MQRKRCCCDVLFTEEPIMSLNPAVRLADQTHYCH